MIINEIVTISRKEDCRAPLLVQETHSGEVFMKIV